MMNLWSDVIATASLTICLDRADQSFDVPVGMSEGLQATGVIAVTGHVVGHHHVFVAHLDQRSHHLQHVDVTVVEVDLLEITSLPDHVAEVDVEDPFLVAEVTDHLVDLSSLGFWRFSIIEPRQRFSPW